MLSAVVSVTSRCSSSISHSSVHCSDHELRAARCAIGPAGSYRLTNPHGGPRLPPHVWARRATLKEPCGLRAGHSRQCVEHLDVGTSTATTRSNVSSASVATYLRSKRSSSMTLTHAATKSSTNFCLASELAYTSAMARNSEFEPKSRSTRVPVMVGSPVV